LRLPSHTFTVPSVDVEKIRSLARVVEVPGMRRFVLEIISA
jgi:hypothetical protein